MVTKDLDDIRKTYDQFTSIQDKVVKDYDYIFEELWDMPSNKIILVAPGVEAIRTDDKSDPNTITMDVIGDEDTDIPSQIHSNAIEILIPKKGSLLETVSAKTYTRESEPLVIMPGVSHGFYFPSKCEFSVIFHRVR